MFDHKFPFMPKYDSNSYGRKSRAPGCIVALLLIALVFAFQAFVFMVLWNLFMGLLFGWFFISFAQSVGAVVLLNILYMVFTD